MRILPLCSNKINRLVFSNTLPIQREQVLINIYHITVIMSDSTKVFITNWFFGSNIIKYH